MAIKKRWGSAHRFLVLFKVCFFYLTVIFWMLSVPVTENVTLCALPLHVPLLNEPVVVSIVLILPPSNTMLDIVPSLTLMVIVDML